MVDPSLAQPQSRHLREDVCGRMLRSAALEAFVFRGLGNAASCCAQPSDRFATPHITHAQSHALLQGITS
jgi:hypothetical protein